MKFCEKLLGALPKKGGPIGEKRKLLSEKLKILIQ
jgi:hypothetical protein